ncbi:HAD family hydrolase [Limisalsivibrio acetivorans]|uniref:HAD family hydrolase n=1 Tax=Limisalsivibrio acetivorans TaxID=1304888 RepID=UPI0003B3FF13|nr:HAD family hydrolase [Limisalsivibrio acetivorans]
MHKLIIFDFDGTLADTWNSINKCMQWTFRDHELECYEEMLLYDLIGTPLVEMIEILSKGKGDAEQITETYRKYYTKEGHELTRLFKGSIEAVQGLHEKGYKLAVLSNKSEPGVQRAVKRTGLSPYIQDVFGEREGRLGKPSPDSFLMDIYPRFGIEPADCLMVGDAIPDLAYAQACGMPSCWASFGFGPEKECLSYKPSYIINDISELTDIL